MIDPAQNPFRFRHEMKQTEPSAIRRRAMDRKSPFTARFNPHPFPPGNSMTDPDCGAAGATMIGSPCFRAAVTRRVQAGCVNAVVIRDQKFHRGRNYYVAQPVATSSTLPLEPAFRWAVDFVETRRKSRNSPDAFVIPRGKCPAYYSA